MDMALESLFFIKDLWLRWYWLQFAQSDTIVWKGFPKISAQEERYKSW